MYDVIFKDGKWWISRDGKILDDLEFDDPISPKIIIKEIEENG